jgi:hypothetical protein
MNVTPVAVNLRQLMAFTGVTEKEKQSGRDAHEKTVWQEQRVWETFPHPL